MDLATTEQELLSWMVGANAVALLTGVEAGGGLEALREPVSPEKFAARLAMDETHATRILMALDALGIVTRADGLYRLTDAWAMIAGPDRPASIADRLGFLGPVRRGLEGALADTTAFDAVDATEAEALARSVWGVANSPDALASWAELDAQMPEVRAVWQSGCRHAEFGCGAGRDLVRIVAMYPGVQAVGYDILDNVLAHARALAERVGVEDRIDFRLGDILAIEDENEYDTVLWSHMFFAGETRARAIASLRRALKPGGFLVVPFMPELPEPDAVEASNAARFLLTISVAYRRWNIYWPGSADLRAELESAGFEHLATIPHFRTPFMAMQMRK